MDIHLGVVTLYVMQENKKCVFILFIMCLFYFKLHMLYEKLFPANISSFNTSILKMSTLFSLSCICRN